MHKHPPFKRARQQGWRNANLAVDSTASNAIVDLLTGVDLGESFATEYLREQYLSKYCDEGLTPASERRKAAIDKWVSVETQNRSTNERLRDRDGGYNVLPRVTHAAFCKFATRLISSILGPLDDIIVLGSFSGGASTSRRRTESLPAFKFSDKADATADAMQYLDVMFRQAPLTRQYGLFSSLTEVRGAELFTVPKKTDIDRCACKEPDLNMYLQKGVGRHIRRRLSRFGIDLNDQSKNRRLAREGSLNGTLATLDLSSASDTITIEAVRTLLPTEWFLYLNDIRSHEVLVEGEYHRTEMFSSMGNGFTFELESLLFYALVRTVCFFENVSGVVSIYGDDIICPSGASDMTCWALQEFGFSVNASKSFSEGPFRESCGGHYYEGVDVAPFYLKRKPTHLTDVIRVANQFRRWATTDFRTYELPATYNMWLKLANLVPKELWGGSDLDLDTILVSPGAPNKQLLRLSGLRKVPEEGSYLHWQNSTWRRTQGPSEPGTEPQSTENRCRLRSVRYGIPRCSDLFYEEELELFGRP
jgi:hypothetical protein